MDREKTLKAVDHSPAAAGARRGRYGLQSLALLFAVTTCCVLGVILADRFPRRYDVTATREHQLSPRTVELLGELSGDYEVVITANFSDTDPVAAERTRAVLANFARASARVKPTVINIASAQGLAELDALLARLVQRYAPELEKQRIAFDQSMTSTDELVKQLNAMTELLNAAYKTVKDEDKNAAALRRFLDDSAAVFRLGATDVQKAAADARKRLETPMTGNIPASGEALSLVRKPLAENLNQLKQVADGLDALSKANDDAVTAETRGAARAPLALAETLRDRLARAVTTIDDLPTTPLPAVVRVLKDRSAAIIVGPPGSGRSGVTSFDVSSLFPPRSTAEGARPVQIDLRAQSEELLAAGIASLARSDAPIVVLVHGEGVRLAPDFQPFQHLLGRLGMRGMDAAEWAAGLDEQPPVLTKLNPDGKRPVVYATLSTSPSTPEGAARMKKLADAIRLLVDSGKNVLISVNPSTLPAIGQTDPLVEFLTPLGIQADTGRPLLRQTQTAQGRLVGTELLIDDPHATHIVSAAVYGQKLQFPWPVPLRLRESADSIPGLTPVVTVDNADRTIWAESEWAEYRRVPLQQRAMVSNPPANDSSRDDGAGPWTLAFALERTVSGSAQRLLVVGSNGWFLDAIAHVEAMVDGRRVQLFPGNTELFEAGVYFLANQDAYIGTSAQAKAVPLIPPISDGALSGVRLALIAGLPLLVLLIGGVWRIVRG